MNKKELRAWMETTDNCLDDFVRDLNFVVGRINAISAALSGLERRFDAMQNVNAERLHEELGKRIDALKKKDGQRIDALFAKVNILTQAVEMLEDAELAELDMAVQQDEPPLDSIVVDGEGFVWQRHRIGWVMAGSEVPLSWSKFLDEVGEYELISTEGRIERA